jgi:glycosyltransferase involved in cell wall biosynthesis
VRIAVVHDLPAGGARRRVAGHLQHLEGTVREFTLSTGLPVSTDAAVITYFKHADSAPPIVRPMLRYTDLGGLYRAWHQLAQQVREWRPDVVYANPCRYLQSSTLGDVGAPVVYYCDEPRRFDYDSGARASTRRLTRAPYAPLRAIERRTDRANVARSSSLLTNSAYTAGRIRDAYGRSAEVVYCGVQEVFSPAPKAVPPEHVLSVGTLIPSKGHDLVLRAAAGSGLGLPVVVVCPRGGEGEATRLRELAASLNVSLRLRSNVSDDELRDLYRSAFATVYLAAAEPFGLVSIEAQASGCPVIVADEGGLPETVADRASGIVVARRGAEAAAALQRMADPAVRGAMVAAARTASRALTWRASAQQVQRYLTVAAAE